MQICKVTDILRTLTVHVTKSKKLDKVIEYSIFKEFENLSVEKRRF